MLQESERHKKMLLFICMSNMPKFGIVVADVITVKFHRTLFGQWACKYSVMMHSDTMFSCSKQASPWKHAVTSRMQICFKMHNYWQECVQD